MVALFAKRGLACGRMGARDQNSAVYFWREKFPYSGKQTAPREGRLVGHLEPLGFASLFASRPIWLQPGWRDESVVLSAFPLVHTRVRRGCRPQLSCQRLYCFRFCFYRRCNLAAKNRPVRPRCGDLAVGGLVF